MKRDTAPCYPILLYYTPGFRMKLGARLSSWNKAHRASSNPRRCLQWQEGLALPSDPEHGTLALQGEPWPKLLFGFFLAMWEEQRKRGREQVVGVSFRLCC